ncbi:transglutaminase domain-containing protein [Flavobacterium yafengii]|uniref:transglutaminase domain-containing protein n=1 Tax=Flavobacterium yafengii TaxID=3041253 RepID=UPI0024A7C7A9|nr:transglutaminase domain-containing protein [Flavobacterium yafengii]MDI5886768.1 transglutaminase domain-containing protein [Flavobacterium yafengii]
MKNICLVLFFFFSLLSFGQVNAGYPLVDAKMAAIPASSITSTDAIAKYINSNFKTETDKIRAVFYWTSSNISYDVANMFTINFNETVQEQIARTLRTKKGVCIHYAVVFNELSQKTGIQSYIIDGYTKQNGKVSDLAHAWIAAKIDKKWYVFDPTWGSGYVNNGRFYKKINNYYFKAEPAKIIASHIPFDYLWQFSNYPITNGEFYEGKIQINKTKKYFDFEKEIIKYNALSEADQLFDSAERIEKNGLKNAMILERYEGKKQQLTYLRHNTNIEKLNSIVNEMNQAVVLLNDFIYYRNNKFKPALSDDEISNMIETPREQLVKCQNDIYSVGSVGSKNASNVASIKKSIGAALAQAEEHSLFVKNYLSKSKIVRKTMFSKVSWFGVPLN